MRLRTLLLAVGVMLFTVPAFAQIPGGGGASVTGTLTIGNCVKASGAKSIQDAGSACGAAAGVTVGATTIAGGTPNALLYDNAGTLGNTGALPNGTTATTQAANDNSTKVATTAYVNGASPPALGVLTTTATSNPSATSSGTGVMMGLSHQLCGGSTDCSITPAKSGKVVFFISGKIQNSLGGASGSSAIDLYYGTGTAPTNGTAPGSAGTTRTDCTSNAADTSGANEAYPVNLTCVATGLTVGTAYWVDAALTALTGGTTTMKRATISAYEIY